jgi:S-DNA-T family DNA segregation ATPase FtsK/SpoIIIE
MEQIEKISSVMREKWTGKKAKPIPEIPENPVWADYMQMEETERLLKDDRHLPIGYNMKNAQPYGINLSKIYCYLIAGKARSGKTNLFKVMIKSALMKNALVTIIDFSSELSLIAEDESLEVINKDDKMFAFFNELLPDFKDRNIRKRENMKAGMSDEEIYVDMLSYRTRFIFIANLADFVIHVTNPVDTGDMKGFVENILDKGSLHNVFWVACYNSDDVAKVAGTKIYDTFLKYKTGIHFGGNVAAQRIMNFDYVPYLEQSKTLKPGIGMLPANDDDDVRKVMVPLVKG